MTDQEKKEQLLQKFVDGDASPSETHRALAWGGARCLCGGPAVVRLRVFAPMKDVMGENPQFALQLAAHNDGRLPVVDFKDGKYVRVSETFACAACRQTAEREAAKAPSWCVVELDRGPKDTMQVGA